MRTTNSALYKSVVIVVTVGSLVFAGLSFKSEETKGQVMTVLPLQSKSAMKGDRDLCLILDGKIIEKIEMPSAFSTKLEDQLESILLVNKTVNKLSREGWRITDTEGLTYVLVK